MGTANGVTLYPRSKSPLEPWSVPLCTTATHHTFLRTPRPTTPAHRTHTAHAQLPCPFWYVASCAPCAAPRCARSGAQARESGVRGSCAASSSLGFCRTQCGNDAINAPDPAQPPALPHGQAPCSHGVAGERVGGVLRRLRQVLRAGSGADGFCRKPPTRTDLAHAHRCTH